MSNEETDNRQLAPAARQWLIATSVAASAALVGAVATVPVAQLADPLAWALAAGIAIGVAYPIWTSGHPHHVATTVEDLFVAAMLFVLHPATVVLASAVGWLVGRAAGDHVGPLAGSRSRSAWVWLHNISIGTLGAAAAAVTTSLLIDRAGVPRPLAVAAGLVALQLVSWSITVVVVTLDVRQPLRRLVRSIHEPMLTLPISGALGLLLGQAVATVTLPIAWVALTAGTIMLVAGLSVHVARDRHRLQVMLDASRSLADAGKEGHSEDTLIRLVRDCLYARRVELVTTVPDWAQISAPVGEYGWIVAAGRTLTVYSGFDGLDRELLEGLAAMGQIALDNAGLVNRLREEDEIRSALLAAAAHDLRSPLTVTTTAMTTLRQYDGALDPETRGRLLDATQRATAKATRLVHDLIELERQHLDGRSNKTARADVLRAVSGVLAELEEQDLRRIRVEVPHDLSPASIEAVQLERILDNLLGNARKYTPEGGRVWVRAWKEDGGVSLAVEDEGDGIPPDERDAIFEPFRRGNRPMRAKGFGLGLHVAAQFVRFSGGRIWADQRDGGGASFRIWLPAVNGAAGATETAGAGFIASS